MKIRVIVTALAALFAMPAVWAQATAGQQAAAKVGVMNIQAAIASTAEGKQAAAELQSRFAPRTTELQNLQKQMDEIQSKLQAGQNTLSDDARAQLARQGDQLNRTFQRKRQEFQDDTNDAQQDVVNTIGRKMIDVLDNYAKENGYSVILDTSSQQTPVVYAANQVDITQDIIRLYDQSYPVKTGAATPTKPSAPPATPRPAPGTTPPPKP